jgi:hypothetical protein
VHQTSVSLATHVPEPTTSEPLKPQAQRLSAGLRGGLITYLGGYAGMLLAAFGFPVLLALWFSFGNQGPAFPSRQSPTTMASVAFYAALGLVAVAAAGSVGATVFSLAGVFQYLTKTRRFRVALNGLAGGITGAVTALIFVVPKVAPLAAFAGTLGAALGAWVVRRFT